MTADARGWRMALVPPVLVNPPAGAAKALRAALGVLEECGYGLLQLPPQGTHGPLLAVICDQVAEYTHHGHAVAAVGIDDEPGNGLHWSRLAPLLRIRGVEPPPRHVLRAAAEPDAELQRLRQFLRAFDLPAAERERWRG